MPETETISTSTEDVYEGNELNLELVYDGVEVPFFPYNFPFILL